MGLLFSNTLRKLRIEKGLSQQELADKVYVTRSSVVRWETGIRLPDTAMISRLAKALGVDVHTLFLRWHRATSVPMLSWWMTAS